MGLAGEDYASIGLGILLFLLILGIIVGILVKKGYIGRKVSPSAPIVDDKPKLMSNFSRSGNSLYSESIGPVDHSTPRSEFKPGLEANPIIYLYNDIYYPPNTLAFPEKTIISEKPAKRKKHKKVTRDRSPAMLRKKPQPIIVNEPPMTKSADSENEDIVVIPDTGIHLYTRYGYRDPYDEWRSALTQNS